MRIDGISAGVALAAIAAALLYAHARPSTVREQLRDDPASPYLWCDLADSLLQSGDATQAGYCFRRAVALGPNLPPICIRALHFYLATGQVPEALSASAHVLRLVHDYDPFIFGYYDRFVPDVATLLPLLAQDRRALEAYLRHLIGAGESARVRALWPSLSDAADDKLASDYVNFLLRTGDPAGAAEIWAAHVGRRRGPRARRTDLPRFDAVSRARFEITTPQHRLTIARRLSSHGGHRAARGRFPGSAAWDCRRPLTGPEAYPQFAASPCPPAGCPRRSTARLLPRVRLYRSDWQSQGGPCDLRLRPDVKQTDRRTVRRLKLTNASWPPSSLVPLRVSRASPGQHQPS